MYLTIYIPSLHSQSNRNPVCHPSYSSKKWIWGRMWPPCPCCFLRRSGRPPRSIQISARKSRNLDRSRWSRSPYKWSFMPPWSDDGGTALASAARSSLSCSPETFTIFVLQIGRIDFRKRNIFTSRFWNYNVRLRTRSLDRILKTLEQKPDNWVVNAFVSISLGLLLGFWASK